MIILRNPIREWLRCCRVFKAPSLKVQVHKDISDRWYYGDFSRRYFGIWSFALDYKLKYGEPRHIENPKIVVKVLDWVMSIELVAPAGGSDMLYYEGMLWYLYKGKSVKNAYFNNIWYSHLDSEIPEKNTIGRFLRDKYRIECLEADVHNSYKNYVEVKSMLKESTIKTKQL